MQKICPYPGLRPFNEQESLYFKGRDKHIDRIKRQLEKEKFLMVTGASGDGKSSLIYAGLIPHVKAGFLKAQFNKWAFASFRPERTPLRNMANALASAIRFDDGQAVENSLRLGFSALVDLYKSSTLYLTAQQANDSTGLGGLDKLERSLNLKQAANLFILVDQFEELFTYPENFKGGRASDEVQVLINLIQETHRIALEEQLPIYIVCTMRSDYISHCAALRDLPELIGESHFFVPRLKRNDLYTIIEEPAMLSGNKVSKRLVTRLVNDIKEGTDILPVLQHALNRIYHQHVEDISEEMDLIHYSKVGGVSISELPDSDQQNLKNWYRELPDYKKDLFRNPQLENVLNAHANEIYETLVISDNGHEGTAVSKEDAQRILRSAFICLTRIDDNKAVRNRMTLQEIAEMMADSSIDTEIIGKVLDNYRKQGNTFLYPFLSEDDPNSLHLKPDTLLDITHEALIRNWQNLSDWTYNEHDTVQTYEDYNTQLSRWLGNNKSAKFLLSRGSLSYFEDWFFNQDFNPIAWLKRYMSLEDYVNLKAKQGSSNDAITTMEAKSTISKERLTEFKEGRYAKYIDHHFEDIKEYLQKSRENVNKRQRVAKLVTIAISILLVISVAALFWNIHLRKISSSNEIAMKAFLKLEDDPTLAFRLAEKAFNIYEGKLAKMALMESYGEYPYYNILQGYPGSVVYSSFSPDGKYILTGSYYGGAALHDLAGNKLYEYKEQSQSIYSGGYGVDFTSDFKYILTSSYDSTACLWGIKGDKIAVLGGHQGAIYSVRFSHNDKYILTASGDGKVGLWDLEGKNIWMNKYHKKHIRVAKFSNDNEYIITASSDHTSCLLNLKGDLLRKFEGHQDAVVDVLITKNNERVITSSWDKTIRIWSVQNNDFKELTGHTDLVWRISLSSDEKILASCGGSVDGTVRLWNLKGEQLKVIDAHKGGIWSIRFSNDQTKLISASFDGTAKVWNLNGDLICELKGHATQLYDANFSPDGKYVVTASGDQTARVWCIKPQYMPILKGHTDIVNRFDISADGKYIVTEGRDFSARVWSITGYPLSSLDKHSSHYVGFAKFANKKGLIITGSYDDLINIWDFEGNLKKSLIIDSTYHYDAWPVIDENYILLCDYYDKHRLKLLDWQGNILQVIKDIYVHRIDKKGEHLITANEKGGIKYWSFDDKKIQYVGTSIVENTGNKYLSFDFSDDSKYFLTVASSDTSLSICDNTGEKLWSYKIFKTGISYADFSDNSAYVACVLKNNTAVIFDIYGNIICELIGHNRKINDVEFSPEYKFILTGSEDNSAKLWDLEGNELETYTGHSLQINDVGFLPDGKYIITASNDHTVRIYPMFSEDLLSMINEEKVRGEVWGSTEREDKKFDVIEYEKLKP